MTHTGKGLYGNNRVKSAADLILLERKWTQSVKNQGSEGYGKDEVSGSNPDSSSTKTALFAWKGRFCFAFCDFFAYLKFVIAALTTEQATDREKWVSEGVLPPEARCFFRLPFPVLSSKQSPASFPESAGPVFFHIPPRCRRRRCGPRVFR